MARLKDLVVSIEPRNEWTRCNQFRAQESARERAGGVALSSIPSDCLTSSISFVRHAYQYILESFVMLEIVSGNLVKSFISSIFRDPL